MWVAGDMGGARFTPDSCQWFTLALATIPTILICVKKSCSCIDGCLILDPAQ
jgi:ribonuclease PH